MVVLYTNGGSNAQIPHGLNRRYSTLCAILPNLGMPCIAVGYVYRYRTARCFSAFMLAR